MTAALILATWLLWVLASIGLGLIFIRSVRWRLNFRDRFHSALWIGLGLLLLVSSSAQLFFGLGHSWGTVLALALLLAGLAYLVRTVILNRTQIQESLLKSLTWRRFPVILALALLVIGLIDVSYLATGEPMDADAGSYRIGSILYASEYRLIPGLANLHFRFGFNSSMWPFAALIGQAPWTGQGYRLVTGVFVTALTADVLMRIGLKRTKGPTAGDWFLIIATGFTGGIILTDTGRWIPSPAQDVAVLIVCAVSTAFLADFVASRGEKTSAASLAIITAAVAGSLRPLGWIILAFTVLVVTPILVGRIGGIWGPIRALRASLIFGTLLASVMAIRDAILTGWILYPLDLLALPVPWISTTTDVARNGITAYGRAPDVDMAEVLSSSAWFGPWLETLLSSREVFFFQLMLIGAALPLLWSRGRRAWLRAWKPLALTLLPSLAATGVWFATAPDLRFGWGPLLALAALPGAFVLWAKGYPHRLATWLGVVLIGAFMATQVLNGRYLPRGGESIPSTTRIGPVVITIDVAPPPTPAAITGTLEDGTPVLFPSVGGNCYDIFPLCLLPGSGSNVKSLGAEITDGFAVADSDR